ncbi:uncharacterized protein LOC111100791 isoform X1 [Crassostrea virginica]
MEETESETSEGTIYVYQYPADGQGEGETRVIEVGAKDSAGEEEEVTTVTQYVEEVVEIDNENVVVANVMAAASEKGSIKLVLSEEDSNQGEHGYTMNYRPIRPVERQKMRPWLLEHLDSGSIPGLSWQNRTQRIFRISWKHAAHNCFNRTRDSDLFERWAYHTGRHHDGNHKRWKANFRCALNSLPDVIELKDLGVRKGDNAFKVYKFIDLNDEKDREEKKKMQMVTRSSKKTEGRKGGSTPVTPIGTKHLKTESGSPAAFSITTEGGMLQTLLHAIELKNQEAASDKDEDKKTKVTVKRALDQENQPRPKRTRGDYSKKSQTGESTESSEEEEEEEEDEGDSETGSQASSTSHASPGTPTSSSMLSMLKLPYILNVKQLLALANKQKDTEVKASSMGDSKVTITNVTLDSILQDRLSQNTDNSNVKITIPYTVFEALKARNASGKDAVTLEGTHSNVVLTPGSGATTSKTRLVPLLTSKDANYPNIRSRLVSRLNMSGAQAVTASQGQSQGQVLRPVLAAAGKKGGAGTFEKVTVQPIPQLQPVRLGSPSEESDQDNSKISISTVNINADDSHPEAGTSSKSNKKTTDANTVTEQVTVDLKELMEDQSSSDVEGNQYRCLWCKLDFSTKIDLLSHFMSLHEDMLIPEGDLSDPEPDPGAKDIPEANEEVEGGAEDEEEEEAFIPPMDTSGALDLTKPKVTVEKNPGMMYTNVVDLSFNTLEEGEGEGALDLSNSKKNLVVNEINVPPADNRPQYSLNSLIEALRNTIEQDRKDKRGPVDSYVLEVEDEEEDLSQQQQQEKKQFMEFLELSSDSDSESEVARAETSASSTSDVKISVKTFQVNGKTMYRCTKCNRVFSKSCTLSRHALVHTQLFPYLCGICDSEFRDMRVLLKHLDLHGEDVDCPCQKCEKINREKTTSSSTAKVKNTAKKFKFKCDICGKQFSSAESCSIHVESHASGTVSVSCNICKMKFSCHRTLTRHRMSSHSLQNCPVCLESSSDLAAHMVNHPGVFIYKCGLCSDGFNRRPELHDHLKVHTSLGNTKPQNQLKRRVKPLSKKTLEARLLKKTKSAERKATKKRMMGKTVRKGEEPESQNIKVETFVDKGVVTKALIIPEKEESKSKDNEREAKVKTTGKAGDLGNIPHFMMIDSSVDFEVDPNIVKKDEESRKRKFVDSGTTATDVTKVEIKEENFMEEVSEGKTENHSSASIKSESSSPVSSSSGPMSLRRRTSRRCRWHDNDSVCERCDGSFIKTIAFERKQQKKTSPTSSSTDLSQLVPSEEDIRSLGAGAGGAESMVVVSNPVSTAN